MLEYRYFRAPNGLRIILIPVKNDFTVSTVVTVRIGSRSESKKFSGISHFIEHIFFKGGLKYPTSFELARALERYGAVKNAYTSKEVVAYFVKLDSAAGPLGIDVLEDMMIKAKFADEELEKEKGTIIQERRMRHDDPDTLLLDIAIPWLFYGEHPLGQEIIGTEKTISGFCRNDLVSFKNIYYTSDRVVVSVAGDFNVDEMRNVIENSFGSLSAGDTGEWEEFDTSAIPAETVCVIPRIEKEGASLVLAASHPGYMHNDRYAIEVAETILGGSGMSFRLFQELRAKTGLVYSVYSGSRLYREIGEILTLWSTGNNNIEASIFAVLNEYKKIRETYVSDEELDRAKGFINGQTKMAFADSLTVARSYALNELQRGAIVTLEQYRERISSVSKEDVLRVAQAYLTPEKLKLAMVAKQDYCDREKLEEILTGAR